MYFVGTVYTADGIHFLASETADTLEELYMMLELDGWDFNPDYKIIISVHDYVNGKNFDVCVLN